MNNAWGPPDPEFIKMCSDCGEWAAAGGGLCEDCKEDSETEPPISFAGCSDVT